MKTLISVLYIILIIPFTLFAQEKKELSRIDKILSETGKLIRYDDYNLSTIKGPMMSKTKFKTYIRVINSGSKPYSYFLMLDIEFDNIVTNRGSISERELTDVIVAYSSLLEMSSTEKKLSDYANIKYVSDDGLQIGYYVSKGKLQWFINVDKYSLDGTFYQKKSDKFEKLFIGAQKRIEQLKASGL